MSELMQCTLNFVDDRKNGLNEIKDIFLDQ